MSFNTIEEVKQHVEYLKNASPYEINEHLATLQRLGSECESICEFGVATGTSTWAFLSTEPKWMRSYDIIKYNELDPLINTVKNLKWDWTLTIQNTTDPEFYIPECDMLFIDALHNGNAVGQELKNNGNLVKKYIVFHDTEKYGERGGDERGEFDDSLPGIMEAIRNFLKQNSNWRIKEQYDNNHGLLVIERC